MASGANLAGAAHLVMLPANVIPMDPQPAVFDAMLDGWMRQQRVRSLKDETIEARRRLVRRLFEYSNLYPWQWTVAELEAFIDQAGGSRRLADSTVRGYEVELRLFLEYVTDARYGWPTTCLERFGQAPQQLLHERNTTRHRNEFEGHPGRRPLTYDEVQLLFDAADARVEQVRALGRKGVAAALRDAALLKVVYAYGLRRREAGGLDLVDRRRNPKAPQFGQCGAWFVRWGKGCAGGPPRRRTVLTVPEMDWVVQVVEEYLAAVRPLFSPGSHPAVWVTERRGRLSVRGIDEAFERCRVLAHLPEELDLHSLRHSYVTHLLEFGYPERFVQDQCGHTYASSTAIYSGVGDEYRNRILLDGLRQTSPRWWEEEV